MLGVLVQTYEFWPFLQGLGVVIILVMNLGLQVVIQLHGPILNG